MESIPTLLSSPTNVPMENTSDLSTKSEDSRQRRQLQPPEADTESLATMEDAFNRVTASLAASAWGSDNPPPTDGERSLVELSLSEFSAFTVVSIGLDEVEGEVMGKEDKGMKSYNRTTKVAKASYSDHGSHSHSKNRHDRKEGPKKSEECMGSILKCLTFSLEQTYNKIEQENKHTASRTTGWEREDAETVNSNSDVDSLSPLKNPVDMWDEEGEAKDVKSNKGKKNKKRGSPSLSKSQMRSSHRHDQDRKKSPLCNISPSSGPVNQSKTESSASVATNVTRSRTSSSKSTISSRNSSNIALKSRNVSDMENSTTSKPKTNLTSGLHAALNSGSSSTPTTASNITYHDNYNAYGAESCPPTRGECLTTPPEPSSNGGLDNSEGNLIVHVNDILSIPKHHITFHSSQNHNRRGVNISGSNRRKNQTINFLVLELLGQGTFAQVFKCRNMVTNEMVAVKIVKNKPAYTRQAAVEIDVFRALMDDQMSLQGRGAKGSAKNDNMVTLLCYFMYHSHLCLVFELLGLNLYEVLKKRQFRGLPIGVVQSLVIQAIEAVKDLSQRSVVHCDLKPENILLVDEVIASIINAGDASSSSRTVKERSDSQKLKEHGGHEVLKHQGQPGSNASSPNASMGSTGSPSSGRTSRSVNSSQDYEQQKIKLIDFGSACFEGQTAHTYIQSRFYRSPEVLVGLPYDSAIDMWSLGCVAAELFLGLPILPGVHEHDQLGRIHEMIAPLPDWMVEQGSKSKKYFAKIQVTDLATRGVEDVKSGVTAENSRTKSVPPRSPRPSSTAQSTTPPPTRPTWRMKTWQEYLSSLSAEERANRSGLSKLDQQPTNRYFKRKRLADIVMLHGNHYSSEDKKILRLFVHFLKGILDPDPWKRWTAHQASMHPFITGSTLHQNNEWQSDSPRRGNDIYWVPPWDPSICRRKLLSVQKAREKQAQMRRSNSAYAISNAGIGQQITVGRDTTPDGILMANDSSPEARRHAISSEFSVTSRVTAMTDAMSLSQPISISKTLPVRDESISPPHNLGSANVSSRWTSHHVQDNSSGSGVIPPHCANLSASLGTAVGALYHQSPDGGSYVQALTPTLPASLAHFPQGSNSWLDAQYSPAAFVVSPSMHSVNYAGYGDYSYGLQHHLSPNAGPQSFSGVYYDRISSHFPIEAELAYALQRPGVVPSMGTGPNVSFIQQQQGVNPYSYLHHPANGGSLNRQSNVSTPNSNHISSGGRRQSSKVANRNTTAQGGISSATKGGTNLSSGHRQISLQQHPQDQSLDSSLLDSPIMGNDLAFLTGNNSSGNEMLTKSSTSTGGSTGARSLLAQQLAEHSAAAAHRSSSHVSNVQYQQSNVQPQMHSHSHTQLSYQHQTATSYPHHQGMLYGSAGPTNFGSTPLSHHDGAYYSIASANGPSIMLSAATPTNADLRMARHCSSLSGHHYLSSPSSSYGSYHIPYHVQVLQQQTQPFQHLTPTGSMGYDGSEGSPRHYPPNLPQPPPPPQQPPQPHYRGMSM